MSLKVSRNIASLVISRIFAATLVFIAYAALFRYLGTYLSGQYQYVLSFVMLFSVVVDFGIQQLVIKKVSAQKDQAKKYLGNFFAVEFFLALFIFLLIAAIGYFNHYQHEVYQAILLAGLGMVLNALTIPFTAIVSAHEDMHIIAAVNFLDSVVNAAIIFLTIYFDFGIVFLSSIQLFNALIHIVIYNKVIHRYVNQAELWQHLRRLDFSLVREMFKLALPFGMLVGFSIIYNKIDVLIVTAVRGYSETGLYTAAYKFFDLVRFFPAVVSSSLYPFFSNALTGGGSEAVKFSLEKYTKFMIALGVPIAFGGWILAPKLIIAVGGEQFYPAYRALQWLTVAAAALFIYAPVNSLIINQLTSKAVKVTLLNIFVNIFGNLLLVKYFGFTAAAFMTVVSELVQLLLYFYFIRKHIVTFPVMKYFVKPIMAAALMALALLPLANKSLFLTLPLGALIYCAGIIISGFFRKSDLVAAKAIFNLRS